MKTSAMLHFIFSKPMLAALFVGVGIHALFALNEAVNMDSSYTKHLMGRIRANPIDGILAFLIPFIIPLIVTSISKSINTGNIRQSMLKYPESNPDIIINLDRSTGNVTYINPSAAEILKTLGIDEQDATKLLPPAHIEIVSKLCHECGTRSAEHRIGKMTIDYTFKSFLDSRTIFISGRDITARKSLELSVQNAYANMVEMTSFLDRTLRNYDPASFDMQRHLKAIISALLKNKDEDAPEKATHILLATRDGQMLNGHIYSKSAAGKVLHSGSIEVNPNNEKVAITLGKNDVVWSNWEGEADSLQEYQKHFSPQVREQVGTIERFATYTSGDIAIIAFYQGKRVDTFDAYVLKGLATYANSLKRIADESKDTENAFIYTIETLARASEANDEDTGEHIVRVNKYSALLARKLVMDEKFITQIGYLAQMHDVGKIHIPAAILRKQGSLEPEEMDLIREHPLYGARILGDSTRLSMAAEIARTHHEKFDGSGYPQGLAGDDIPISGRIVMIADVYDALRQERSYKPALTHQQALEIITRGDGRTKPSDFDPAVLKAFVDMEGDIEEIFSTNQPDFTN